MVTRTIYHGSLRYDLTLTLAGTNLGIDLVSTGHTLNGSECFGYTINIQTRYKVGREIRQDVQQLSGVYTDSTPPDTIYGRRSAQIPGTATFVYVSMTINRCPGRNTVGAAVGYIYQTFPISEGEEFGGGDFNPGFTIPTTDVTDDNEIENAIPEGTAINLDIEDGGFESGSETGWGISGVSRHGSDTLRVYLQQPPTGRSLQQDLLINAANPADLNNMAQRIQYIMTNTGLGYFDVAWTQYKNSIRYIRREAKTRRGPVQRSAYIKIDWANNSFTNPEQELPSIGDNALNTTLDALVFIPKLYVNPYIAGKTCRSSG